MKRRAYDVRIFIFFFQWHRKALASGDNRNPRLAAGVDALTTTIVTSRNRESNGWLYYNQNIYQYGSSLTQVTSTAVLRRQYQAKAALIQSEMP